MTVILGLQLRSQTQCHTGSTSKSLNIGQETVDKLKST